MTCRGVLIALLMLLISGVEAELREGFIDPTLTDPAILPLDELPGASVRRLDHFIAVDSNRYNGYLYLHLVGSGGLPENNLEIARHAARLGFHVISLAYPNWPSVRDLTMNSGQSAAPGAVREERLYGVDASPLVNVDEANSVINRLVKLIRLLNQNHPDEGWRRFIVGDLPDWQRIVVGGHSQGAGHAAYLGQDVRLAGVVMFGGPGDFVAGLGVADWLDRSSLTPAERKFGFVHELDPNFSGFQITQSVLGLAAFGPVQDVDVVTPSDWTSHRLSSSRLDIPDANFHGAVVVDQHLPRDSNGSPAYSPAWDYLLDGILFIDSFSD